MYALRPLVFTTITLLACVGTGCQQKGAIDHPPPATRVAEPVSDRSQMTPTPPAQDARPEPTVHRPRQTPPTPPPPTMPDVPKELRSTAPLEIQIRGLQGEGEVFVAVFESPHGFPNHEHAKHRLSKVPTDEQLTLTIEGIATGTISVAAFQDTLEDGQLTKGAFGIPREPYGFSNNVRGRFGPPRFTAAAFELSDQPHLMEILLK